MKRYIAVIGACLFLLCHVSAGFPQNGKPPASPADGPQLRMTGEQAKAVVEACRHFQSGAGEFSPAESTDVTQYNLRLYHESHDNTFTVYFDSHGVETVPEVKSALPLQFVLKMDGDEIKALNVVYGDLQKWKPTEQREITNYDISFFREGKSIRVFLGSHAVWVYWPAVNPRSGKMSSAGVQGRSFPSRQFILRRDTYEITERGQLSD